MKNIPARVLYSWLLCAGCFVLAGVLGLMGDQLKGVAQLIAVLGILGVARETFRWGACIGYVMAGQALSVRIEHVLRGLAMTLIGVVIAGMAGSAVLQVIYEAFWHH